ncbi:MAG: PLP-dependent aminotransferase family protein [Chloroflexi bacterium]|nr:PLP-dependent aminotransferase family protein [Chloroflexota bacterium]
MNNENLIVQTPSSLDRIDLGMGNPDVNLLPESALQRATEKAFAKGIRASLRYGATQGNGYFRESLADFMTRSLAENVDASSLFISNGVSSALDLLVGLLTRPGDTIFVENPTYFLAPSIFSDHGLNIVSIPLDNEGLDIDILEEKLAIHRPKLLYTIPIFQNPSGHTLSLERREKLIELAEKHDFIIIADEVYHLLDLSGFKTNPKDQRSDQIATGSQQRKIAENLTGLNPPKAFALFAKDSEKVISVNSFSKILAPGLRLGWIHAHQKIIHKLNSCGLIDSGGGMNPFTSAIVHELVEAGDLEKNIALLKETYASRLNVMDKALKEFIPTAEYTLPQGGFFFWVRIPGQDTALLRKKARDFKVDFRQGALFSPEKGMREYMRLCFAFYGEDDIREGIKRLGQYLE